MAAMGLNLSYCWETSLENLTETASFGGSTDQPAAGALLAWTLELGFFEVFGSCFLRVLRNLNYLHS